MRGRARFLAACRRGGLAQTAYGKLGACTRPVDAAVRAFLEETGGGRYATLRFAPPGELAEASETAAYGRPDLPWLAELTCFAFWQGLGYRLASVPALADPAGGQPILWLDLHEPATIVPVASSGELVFTRLAEHLEIHLAKDRDPDDEPFFPESVADGIAGDLELQTLIATGKLARYGAG